MFDVKNPSKSSQLSRQADSQGQVSFDAAQGMTSYERAGGVQQVSSKSSISRCVTLDLLCFPQQICIA